MPRRCSIQGILNIAGCFTHAECRCDEILKPRSLIVLEWEWRTARYGCVETVAMHCA